ncbi:helix-turn-helix transcriptional regulator, partial [Actinocorallia lasiicapitis]
ARTATTAEGHLSGEHGLREAAARAMADGAYGDVAVLVHEMGRLGFARAARPFWQVPVEGPFLRARLDYTRALATGDLALLRETADTFTGCGAALYAAEAYAELAQHARADGDERTATLAARFARAQSALCEGAHTPALTTMTMLRPLTGRERDIAFLAARGLSDKEISERLVLSRRTVGNHLHRIYKKLGVRTRRELFSHIEA